MSIHCTRAKRPYNTLCFWGPAHYIHLPVRYTHPVGASPITLGFGCEETLWPQAAMQSLAVSDCRLSSLEVLKDRHDETKIPPKTQRSWLGTAINQISAQNLCPTYLTLPPAEFRLNNKLEKHLGRRRKNRQDSQTRAHQAGDRGQNGHRS